MYGHQKYIIVEKMKSDERVAIVFDDMFTHKHIARGASVDWEGRRIAMVWSAGFIYPDGTAYGESESLGIESQEGDTEVIRKCYTFPKEEK